MSPTWGVRSCLYTMGFDSLGPCPDPYESSLPVACIHVTSRGDGRETIFLGAQDRHLFLGVLSEVVPDFNRVVHTYCLMVGSQSIRLLGGCLGAPVCVHIGA